MLSEYNTTVWFCAISSRKIAPNKVTAEPLRISKSKHSSFIHEWTVFLNESSESVIHD